MSTTITTAKPKSIYLTARDPSTGRSKTVTVRGKRITAASVISLVLRALREQERKAS